MNTNEYFHFIAPGNKDVKISYMKDVKWDLYECYQIQFVEICL